MNQIVINSPIIEKDKITYQYQIFGEWKEAFNEQEQFYIRYSCDISKVPESVAVVPLLANLLPMAWVYDAEIVVPVCDKDFYKSIPEFKKGYADMYPMMKFGGKLTVGELQKNRPENQNGSAAFFSGGVDAFNTLTQHTDEEPTLITLWGADVKFEDKIGWKNVQVHLFETAKKFKTDYVMIKSCFRRFLNENVLNQKVQQSGDGWWHGFQHGIGLISHAAPISYIKSKKCVYIASSYTIAEKGKVTCASDPTIDNYVKFCGTKVEHDGYEFNRQAKIHNIVNFSEKSGVKIPLRVCWESQGGQNCCNCEKCFRTILGIYAEGKNPHEYGFDYSQNQLRKISFKMHYSGLNKIVFPLYIHIQQRMRERVHKSDLPQAIQWFYDADISKIREPKLWYTVGIKIYGKVIRLIRQ